MIQNNITKYIQSLVIILLLLLTVTPSYSQASRKRNNPPKSSGSDYTSRDTRKKNARRGGRNSMPVGIEGKKINLGFGVGVALPGLSISSEEHATTGLNSHFYAHYLFGKKTTVGVGANVNYIFLGTNNSKFSSENQTITKATTFPWTAYTISPSLIINQTIIPRVSAQFLINGGGLFVNVPQTRLTYTDSINQGGDPTIVIEKSYVYKMGVEKSWFLSGALQFNYALSRNMEARVGLDYFYGRFNYTRINESDITLPSEKLLREMKLIDVFVGLAFSF